MTYILEHARQRFSFDELAPEHSAPCADDIDLAPEDALRSWLLELGLTAEEITASELEGETVRSLAHEQARMGFTFNPTNPQ